MAKYQGREQLDAIDAMIRKGQTSKARKQLTSIKLSTIPRLHLADFGALARRCNLWDIGLTVLRPFIYEKVKNVETATKAERIEYALCLRRAGALEESEKLLADPNLQDEPKATLARAFNAMVQWNYEAALNFLDQYLKTPLLEYDALVADINRLACLQALGRSDFQSELLRLEPRLDETKHPLLFSNFQEIAAQGLIDLEFFEEAEARLKKAEQSIEDEENPYARLIRKWQRISEALGEKSTAKLEAFRKEALVAKDWETLRHLDLYLTQLNPVCEWADRVYFCTPYPSFRRKLEKLRLFDDQAWIQAQSKSSNQFDPWFPGHDEGEILHRLTVYLLQDWYKPASLGGIFENLYQGEHFDVENSVTRVRQQISRLKVWLEKKNIPLRFFTFENQYGLRPLRSCAVLMRKKILSLEKTDFAFSRYQHLAGQQMSVKDWSETFHMTPRQISYLLKQGEETGWIERSGSGRYTEYLLRAEKFK